MGNRLNELEKSLPESKEAIDNFINCIASFRDSADDRILSKTIKKLHKQIETELRDEF